jgi:hypothetical protein
VLPEEYQKRLEEAGLPKHVALATTQLSSIVGSGVIYLESDGIIRARDVFASQFDLHKLICANI